MTILHSRNVQRAGFTMIELLVVIAIITVLVSLSAAGVMKVMLKIPEVQTRSDISEMDVALAAFMTDYNLSDPPPSVLYLNESNPLSGPSASFLQKVFGKNLGPTDWNGDGQINGPSPGAPWVLEGEQCLLFYLGGIPSMASGTPACLGFSTNNMKPSFGSMPGETMGARKGPYFPFQSSRLVSLTTVNPSAPSPFFVYIDAWQKKNYLTPPVPAAYTLKFPKPYAYFSSSGLNNGGYKLNAGKDCQSIGAAAYQDAGGNFMFSNRYQIISAGADGVFGTGLWNPSAGASDTSGRDDQANFSRGILGVGQQ